MDDQALLEPVCGHHPHQALVDHQHAGIDEHCLYPAHADDAQTRRRNHRIGPDTNQHVHCNTDSVCHHGVCLGHARHCCRRLLYAGAASERAGGLCGHPQHILPPVINFWPGRACCYRWSHRTQKWQYSHVVDDHDGCCCCAVHGHHAVSHLRYSQGGKRRLNLEG